MTMDKNEIMMGMSIKQEGAVLAYVKIRMYPGWMDSKWVSMVMIVPIVQVTELVAKMDEARVTYFSMN